MGVHDIAMACHDMRWQRHGVHGDTMVSHGNVIYRSTNVRILLNHAGTMVYAVASTMVSS